MQDNLPAVEGVRPTWRPSSRTKLAGHRAGVTLRPILYACWSVCVCVVFAHVRFWSSDYYTNRRRDFLGATRDAGGPHAGRASSVDATRTAVHVVCIPRDAAQRVPATAYRLPRGYSELAGRRRRRYGGLPARHVHVSRVAVLRDLSLSTAV